MNINILLCQISIIACQPGIFVWKQIPKRLKKIQERALRFISRDHDSTYSYENDSKVSVTFLKSQVFAGNCIRIFKNLKQFISSVFKWFTNV